MLPSEDKVQAYNFWMKVDASLPSYRKFHYPRMQLSLRNSLDILVAEPESDFTKFTPFVFDILFLEWWLS